MPISWRSSSHSPDTWGALIGCTRNLSIPPTASVYYHKYFKSP